MLSCSHETIYYDQPAPVMRPYFSAASNPKLCEKLPVGNAANEIILN